jgi:hypothetical protein
MTLADGSEQANMTELRYWPGLWRSSSRISRDSGMGRGKTWMGEFEQSCDVMSRIRLVGLEVACAVNRLFHIVDVVYVE